MDVLKFLGDDPERWIFAITEYFSFLNTLANQRLRIVGFNLLGVAAEWFQWMSWNGLITTWDRFVESVKNRFGLSKYKDPRGALSKLLDFRMVEDYQRECEKLMKRVMDIPDSLLISFYIYGLKLHLQQELLALKPMTLGYVFSLMRIIEARSEEIAEKEQNI
ncbi:ty3-gypsy retrotransposon protein [Tanacetum coccineum]